MALMKAIDEAACQPGLASRPPHSLPELIKAAGLLGELHEAERAASQALIELSQLSSHAEFDPSGLCQSCDRYGHPRDDYRLPGPALALFSRPLKPN